MARAGFEVYQGEVTLTADRPYQQLVARLSPATLTLQMAIDPPTATVWVDGKYCSARTVTGLAIDQDHRIAASAPGRVGKIVIFRTEQGGEKRLQLKLEPARSAR